MTVGRDEEQLEMKTLNTQQVIRQREDRWETWQEQIRDNETEEAKLTREAFKTRDHQNKTGSN